MAAATATATTTTTKEPVIFILGGGPRTGYSVANAFTAAGYTAVIASRHPNVDKLKRQKVGAVVCDVSSPPSVVQAFQDVTRDFGTPDVVVYNAAALTFPAPPDDPLSVEVSAYVGDVGVNLVGGYAALHETTRLWGAGGGGGGGTSGTSGTSDTGVNDGPRMFIATGNVTPFQPSASAVTLGSGKAGLVYLIEVANEAYKQKGWKFYFVSQVTKDGGPVPYADLDGASHGKEYLRLVRQGTGGESDGGGAGGWDVRFVA